jgi:diacylglycerol kinase family enzyme
LYPEDGSPPHSYHGKLSVLKGGQWKEIPEEEHIYVLSTLVSNLEAPFCISPHSKPLDGSMHLVHFGPRSGDEVMRIMGLAYQGGKHVEEEDVRYEAIDGLRIEFRGLESDGRWRRICVDGKIVRVERDGWVEVKKSRERGMLDVVVVE